MEFPSYLSYVNNTLVTTDYINFFSFSGILEYSALFQYFFGNEYMSMRVCMSSIYEKVIARSQAKRGHLIFNKLLVVTAGQENL